MKNECTCRLEELGLFNVADHQWSCKAYRRPCLNCFQAFRPHLKNIHEKFCSRYCQRRYYQLVGVYRKKNEEKRFRNKMRRLKDQFVDKLRTRKA